MAKGTPSRQVAQTPWARSRSTLAGSGTKAAKNQRPSTWHAAFPSELRKALRLFVQLDETQSHWIPFDLYTILLLKIKKMFHVKHSSTVPTAFTNEYMMTI